MEYHQLAVRALEVLGVASALQMCLAEVRGKGLRYSKFAPSQLKVAPTGTIESPAHSPAGAARMIPSRPAMLIIYTPALFLSSSFLLLKLSIIKSGFRFDLPPGPFFAFFQRTDLRITILASAVASHFFKRDLEVLFLHKYSGSMELFMSLTISTLYVGFTAPILYAQQVAVNTNYAPSIDTLWYGVVVYLVGISGNFYHHYILASLRPASSKGAHRYVIPEGGLFSLVVCPHYLFEFIDFLGIAMIAQTRLSLLTALTVAASLGARSRSTRAWYLKKMDGFPKDRKTFIPFVF